VNVPELDVSGFADTPPRVDADPWLSIYPFPMAPWSCQKWSQFVGPEPSG